MRARSRLFDLHRTLGAAACALAAAACGGDRAHRTGSAAGGSLVIATVGDADVLIPPLVGTIQGAQVTSQLFDRLADPDSTLNTEGDAHFRPRLARRWTWAPDSLSIAFALDPTARWHDGQPVRARDVAFSFALATDTLSGSVAAPLLTAVDSVTARDSLTAVVWFHRRGPRQFYDATYNLWVLPEHALARVPRRELAASAFARQPIGSGRFRFASWTAGQQITIVADTANYRGRPALDRVVWAISADPGAATRRLVTGEADVWEQLRGDGLAQASHAPAVRMMPYPSMDVGYLAFNLRAPNGGPAPLLADRTLRRALAGALDRDAMVRNVFDSLALSTSWPQPSAVLGAAPHDVIGPRYDAAASATALDALGWRLGGDSVRTRGGRPLALRLIVPTTSQVRQRLAVLIQAQLARAGAKVTVDALDPAAFGQAMQRGAYDLTLNLWHGDPSPEGILQQWGTPGAGGRGSANITGYRNAAFDALVDSAAARSGAAAGTLWTRAYATLADDVPAVWLYEPRQIAGVHRRLRPAGVRADAWFADLADWSVAPGERLPRDGAR